MQYHIMCASSKSSTTAGVRGQCELLDRCPGHFEKSMLSETEIQSIQTKRKHWSRICSRTHQALGHHKQGHHFCRPRQFSRHLRRHGGQVVLSTRLVFLASAIARLAGRCAAQEVVLRPEGRPTLTSSDLMPHLGGGHVCWQTEREITLFQPHSG